MDTCLICNGSNIQFIDTKFHKAFVCNECGNYSIESYDCCNKPELVFVKYEIEGGQLRLRKACRNCLNLKGASFKHNMVEDINKLKPYLKIYSDQYYENRASDRRDIISVSDGIKDALKIEEYLKYQNYIQNSQVWKGKRLLVLKRDNNLCQGCLKEPAKQVHHTTYANLYNEFLFELISLCERCHLNYHNK